MFLLSLLAAMLLGLGLNSGGPSVGVLTGGLIMAATFVISNYAIRTAELFYRGMRLLVYGGGVIGFLAVVETVTRTNIYSVLGSALGFVSSVSTDNVRDGVYRAYVSSQHPIALSVVLAILLPVAWLLYFDRKSALTRLARIALILSAAGMVAGVLASGSRTGLFVLVLYAIFGAVLRPRVAASAAVVGSFVLVLFAAGLAAIEGPASVDVWADVTAALADQTSSQGLGYGGRIADWVPALSDFARSPIFGLGLGFSAARGQVASPYILDNQYLTSLIDGGLLGVVGVIVLVPALAVRLFRGAFRDAEGAVQRARLAVSLSTSGYALSLLLFDAFSFVQTTLVLAILVGALGGLERVMIGIRSTDKKSS